MMRPFDEAGRKDHETGFGMVSIYSIDMGKHRL